MKKHALYFLFTLYASHILCIDTGKNIIETIINTTNDTHTKISNLYLLAHEVNERVGTNVRALNIIVPNTEKNVANIQNAIEHLHDNDENTLAGLVTLEKKMDHLIEQQNMYNIFLILLGNILHACAEHETYIHFLEELKHLVSKIETNNNLRTPILEKLETFLDVLALREKNTSITFHEWKKLLTP